MRVETEPYELGISNKKERGTVNRLSFLVSLIALFGMVSCHHAAATTGITCTNTTSTSSSTTSTSTCTDTATNITVTIAPATVSVNVVTTQQFLVAIQGGTNSVAIWKVNNVAGGNDTIGRIDSNGLYHAPVTVPSPNTVTVAAFSFEDQNVSASSTVTITPAPVVAITSPSAPVTISSGTANTVAFSATETGGTTNTILWYVGPVGGLGVLGGNSTLGMISSNGVYTPPLTPPIGQSVTVTAAAQDSPTSFATLNVTVSGYSASSFQGQFAFSMSGSNSAGHFYRAGSFTADGSRNLTGVLEDVNTPTSAPTTPISTTGSYTVGADGRGTFQFNDGLTPASFDFVLVNNTQLQIIGFDATGTAAGQAIAQTPSTFANTPLAALNGTYAFDFAGVDGSKGLSEIGEITADGAGNITAGFADINDGGVLSQFPVYGNKSVCTPAPLPAPQPPVTPFSSYSISSNGRGTLALTSLLPTCFPGPTLTLNFYVISRGSAKFVGTDTVNQVAGFTTQQAPNATLDATALNGNYAFILGGSGLGGAIGTAGSFAADGSGHITSGVVDENVATGAPAPALPILANPAGDNYTVAPNGRGTATFTTAGRTYTFVFYLGAVGTSTTAVFQETDSGIASHGLFTLQESAPFALASIQGNYAIDTSGATGGSLQVSTGQIGANGTGSITSGSMDINTAGALIAGQAVTGSYTAPVATGRATLTLTSTIPNFAAYVVSPAQVYVLGIQSGQVAVGALLRQF